MMEEATATPAASMLTTPSPALNFQRRGASCPEKKKDGGCLRQVAVLLVKYNGDVPSRIDVLNKILKGHVTEG